jgi:hypothetical protein
METNPAIFEPANKSIIEDIRTELRLQGHFLTGALEASIHDQEIHENGGVTLTASALGYLEDLETGIAASQIELSSSRLAEMTKYVELRMGYHGKKAASVAYAIIKKQQKEGMPTHGSYAFSKTGFRTEVMEQTFDKNQPKYIDKIDTAAFGSLDKIFNQVKSGTI